MEIKQSIIDYYKSLFPSVQIGNVWWAKSTIKNEFSKMDVGDIILFSIDEYNYNSIRTAPGTIMVKERMKEGREYKTRVDHDNQATAVFRSK